MDDGIVEVAAPTPFDAVLYKIDSSKASLKEFLRTLLCRCLRREKWSNGL